MRERLRGKITFANVVSVVALFLALGGTAVGAFKLPANSVKSKQIAPNAATGADIAESTLGPVPSALSATKAGTASQADNAANADHATTADHANDADTLNGTPLYQLGDGIDIGTANAVANGGTAQFQMGIGNLTFHCDTATNDTVDFADRGGDSFATEIWHPNEEVVADSGTAPGLFSGDNTSFRAQFLGKDDNGFVRVVQLVVSMADKASQCLVTFQTQMN